MPTQSQEPQQQLQQPNYINPQSAYLQEDTSPLSLGNYLVMMILSAIPLVGFILLLVWSFSSNTNVNKKNWARAFLIFAIILSVLSIIISACTGAAFLAAFNKQ